MALETASYIAQLNSANPTSTDTVSQADDHLRLIKSVLKNTFPNLDQPVTATPANLNQPVPKGVIVMWSGTVATIPTGWVLCNGSNSTPDLRGRFIIGAGGTSYTYQPGATGGSATATLTVGNLPAHTHDFSGVTGSGGSHTHSVTDPGHTHTYTNVSGSGSIGTAVGFGQTTATSGSATTGISIVAGGAHTHSFSGTTTSVGSGTAFSILPPYYALAYIMKT